MKKLTWTLAIFTCLIAGCLKSHSNNDVTCNYNDSPLVAPATETDSIQHYLTNNNINGTTKASAGFFYKINTQGTGQPIVNLCSNVVVKYTGKLNTGAGFDSTGAGTATFQLGRLIPGWQKGLPLVSKGGKITLYIPPTLGYGGSDVRNNGVIVIPANSYLVFDIELLDIL